jgi:diguanylate cyclase (GGDEF)-like protein
LNKTNTGMHTNKAVKIRGGRHKYICSRWLFVALIVVFFLTSSGRAADIFVFLGTLAAAAVYNVLVHIYTLKFTRVNYGIPAIISYMDIAVISIFLYQSGGMDSCIYILYFFIIGYSGVSNNKADVLQTGILSITGYAISSILASKVDGLAFNFWRFIAKNIVLLIGTYGISRFNYEVRRYGELHEKEFKLARTDKLTGLANRHYFEQKLREEVKYADFTHEPLNILMFDIDNFKGFNDAYGHVLGDKLLILFSNIIKKSIRNTDTPVRYGGEEILILIRGLDIILAKSVGERIRRQLENQRINVESGEERSRVTVSCGIAQYPRHSANIKKVIELADRALYYAKEQGRNKVIVYNEIGSAT